MISSTVLRFLVNPNAPLLYLACMLSKKDIYLRSEKQKWKSEKKRWVSNMKIGNILCQQERAQRIISLKSTTLQVCWDLSTTSVFISWNYWSRLNRLSVFPRSRHTSPTLWIQYDLSSIWGSFTPAFSISFLIIDLTCIDTNKNSHKSEEGMTPSYQHFWERSCKEPQLQRHRMHLRGKSLENTV